MRTLNYILLLILCIVLFGSCRTGTSNSNANAVKHFGNLDSIMAGEFPRAYPLDSLAEKKDLYALGVMDSLAGEIQVFDGRPYHSMIQNDSVVVDIEGTEYASLIVFAEVSEWRNLDIPLSVANKEALVGFLEYSDQLKRFSTDKPFVFLIEGVVEELDWHIMQKKDSNSQQQSDHKSHMKSGTLNEVSVEILGFYSKEHEGVFTHHNIPIHMHFKSSDGLLAGHVDDLELGPEMTLRLPKFK